MTQYADRRAKELVKKWLAYDEYNYVTKYGHVRIKSKKFVDREYIIWGNLHTLVCVMEKGKEVGRLCTRMRDPGYPKWDIFLAKVLALKADEDDFLAHANPV